MSGAFLSMGAFVGLFPLQHFWFVSNENVSLYHGDGVQIQDEDQPVSDLFFAGRLRKVLDKHMIYILMHCIYYYIISMYSNIYSFDNIIFTTIFCSVLFVLLSPKVPFNENGLQF